MVSHTNHLMPGTYMVFAGGERLLKLGPSRPIPPSVAAGAVAANFVGVGACYQ
jgi:hypothetical protein